MSSLPISIIVPTFNRPAFLRDCLQSLLNQDTPAHEIIVVDDGSTDQALDGVISEFSGQVAFIRKENGGKPSAVNAGLRVCTGALVWVFDDDDIALPSALSLFSRAFAETPEICWATAQWHYSRERTAGGMEVIATSQSPDLTHGALFHLLRSCFASGSVVVRRTAYQAIGGFEQNLARSEDYDVLLRLARRFPGRTLPDIAFHYRQHEGDRGASTDRFAERVSSKKSHEYDRLLFEKFLPQLSLEEFLPTIRRAHFPTNMREAELSKVNVLCAHGFWTEAVTLLLEICAEGNNPLTDAEKAVFIDIHHQWAVLDLAGMQDSRARWSRVRQSSVGAFVHGRVLRWIYWKLILSLRARDLRSAAQFARLLINLAI